MAIKLAELGVGEVITLMKADLSAILTAIDTARSGDSLVLAVPAAADYYDYPNPVIGDGAAHVEVFEDDLTFLNPYSDAANARAVYELPINVRLTYINRNADTPTQMVARGRRYGFAISQVFRAKPTLGDVSPAIKVGISTVASPQWAEGEDTQKIEKAHVAVSLLLKCEEL